MEVQIAPHQCRFLRTISRAVGTAPGQGADSCIRDRVLGPAGPRFGAISAGARTMASATR
jgi:hypothetical protein